MCGILGIVNYKSGDRARFSRSLDLLQHRGPDDSGTLEFPEILLGHRRLSVIDLDSGRQPISSEDGRFHIIFNGEIYNFKEIKKNLEECSYAFRTRSDTEVLLYGYIEYKEKILTRLNGMFSFAVWDDKDKELFLARDSLGQKPLFYAETGDGRFIFSSELNPMINLIPSLNELDMNAMFLYLCFQSVPAPYSIFKKVRRLVPGYYLKFRNRNSELSEYFRFNSFNEKVEREFSELKGGFWAVAEESVKRSLVADVPVGVFLSGGIDSTVITAALHRLGHEKIRTFSVGFKKAVNNEFEFSRMVSKKFRTEHTEILLEPLSMDVINNLVLHFGEPYADTSAIPTYYISNAVKNEIKVVLGGDGGDEMFAGYSTYKQVASALRNRFFLIPFLPVLKLMTVFNFSERLNRKIRYAYITAHRSDKIYPLARTFLNTCLIKRVISGESSGFIRPFDFFYSEYNRFRDLEEMDKVFYADIRIPLANTLLTKTDIAGMANSVEIRAPFLDLELMKFAFSIPPDFKMRNGITKFILKKVLEEYFPEDFIYRRKQGFTPPVRQWLSGERKGFMLDILSEKKLRSHGLFNSGAIQKLLQEFISGAYDHSPFLWILINFQIWYDKFKPVLS